jgi:hypothetical protein
VASGGLDGQWDLVLAALTMLTNLIAGALGGILGNAQSLLYRVEAVFSQGEAWVRECFPNKHFCSWHGGDVKASNTPTIRRHFYSPSPAFAQGSRGKSG